MSPHELRRLARTSADLARMSRFYQHALVANGRTWLARLAAEVAADLADGHTTAAIYLDQAASQMARESA